MEISPNESRSVNMPSTEGAHEVELSKKVGSATNDVECLHDMSRSVLDRHAIFWLTVIHVSILISPFFFTKEALVATVILHWLTGGLGICLGYHRYFTHAGFKTTEPVKWILAVLGNLSGEGSVSEWVANHRKHHAYSDQHGDPHSPHDGSWWSHMVWLLWQYPQDVHEKHIQRWAPDLAKDPALQFIARNGLLWHTMLGVALTSLGFAIGGVSMAASFLIWGMFVRLGFVLHATWFVNSASHMWGYRNYVTTDDSRNNWWVALITYGEGWHNNHHAYPRMAAHGHRWWEFDMTWWAIKALRATGLAWDVVDYKRASDKKRDQDGEKRPVPKPKVAATKSDSETESIGL